MSSLSFRCAHFLDAPLLSFQHDSDNLFSRFPFKCLMHSTPIIIFLPLTVPGRTDGPLRSACVNRKTEQLATPLWRIRQGSWRVNRKNEYAARP